MDRFVNLGLMKHPLNWLTLFAWVAVFGFLIHIFDHKLRAAYPPQQTKA